VQAVDAIIEALAENTTIQATARVAAPKPFWFLLHSTPPVSLVCGQVLYFQGFGLGMLDPQLVRLTSLLQMPKCAVWAMNIGESARLSHPAWVTFASGLKNTKLGAMFAEPNFLPEGLKQHMIHTLSKNRTKHRWPPVFLFTFPPSGVISVFGGRMWNDPKNMDVILKCEKMWWNPARST
jgi:hypothetical protein